MRQKPFQRIVNHQRKVGKYHQRKVRIVRKHQHQKQKRLENM